MFRNFLLFIFLSTRSFAQLTIQESDFAIPGDTVRYSQSIQIDYDPTITGQGMTWDYSNLVANSQFLREFTSIGFSPVQFTFGILAPTNYQASYFIPDNTIPIDQLNGFLPVVLSDIRSYQKSTQDSITKVGFSIKVNGIDVAFKSDTIETKYKFPMEYQQSFFTKGYTFVDLNPAADFKIKQNRYVNTSIDGFGQLILPFGSFQVLKLKREILEIDSVYQTFVGTGAWFAAPPMNSIEYEWITVNAKDVLLKIVTNDVNGLNQIQQIEYQDVYLGLDASISENNENFNVYPNPAQQIVNVQSSNEIKSLKIIDITGQLLLHQKSDLPNSAIIDVSNLTAGMYSLLIETLNGPRCVRISIN